MKNFKRIEPTATYNVGGEYKRKVVVKRFETEDGKVHEFTTMLSEKSRSGGVIALTPTKQVVVTYQFRAGPERWMYELPGGAINEGEDPQKGVLRELEEETGYKSDQVIFLGNSCRDAYTNKVWYYYLALDCIPSSEGHSRDEEEVMQGLETQLISIDQLIENAKKDQMTDPAAVLMAYDMLLELQRKERIA